MTIGDTLKTCDFEALTLLKYLHVCTRFTERIVRTSIQPSKSASKGLYLQLSILEELLIHCRYLILSSCRWFDVSGHFNHLIRIEIQSDNSIVALWMLWLFLDAQTVSVLIKFCHTIAFRIVHPITEHGCFVLFLCGINCFSQHLGKTRTLEDIITQYQTSTIFTNEVGTNRKCLCQTVRTWLLCIFEMHAIVASVTKQSLESWEVEWGRDNQYVTDTSQHQHADRVVHHRFVIYRHQLLTDSFGDRVETGS